MNLPFILDIAIGLILIYLILSLLASEIQEFLSTVFQWRAKHLKDSIENLLAGSSNEDIKEIVRVKKLVNQLYTHPLIDNINQEAKGLFVNIPRWLTWKIGDLYHGIGILRRRISGLVTRRKPSLSFKPTHKRKYLNAGLKNKIRSAPSYIPSETFATTLLETLQIPTLLHKFSEAKLENFKEYILKETKDCLLNAKIPGINENKFLPSETEIDYLGNPAGSLLKQRFKLEKALNKLIGDFKDNKATLETSVERIEKRLENYISISQTYLTNEVKENKDNISTSETDLTNEVRENFEKNLNDLKDNLLVEGKEREVLLRGLKPSLAEVVKAFKKGTPAYTEIIKVLEAGDQDTCKKVKTVINHLPNSVRQSISVLAERAQSRVELTETDINQLRQEIELWFDRSMQRASGVYKRNAKGVAILIGLSIAFAINADTFHMVTRLSKDSSLRTAITQRVGQVVEQNRSTIKAEDLNAVIKQVDQALTYTSLPLGWGNDNIEQQKKESEESSFIFSLFKKNPIFKEILGWIVTAIAISMGANFWFDLLGKVINVRNTGGKPAPSTTESKK